MEQENLEIKLMQRVDETQYFELWVRSETQSHRLFGTIVERGFNEVTLIEFAAGALAEEVCEKCGDEKLDPSFVASQALKIYHDYCLTNPRPQLGDEDPLAR